MFTLSVMNHLSLASCFRFTTDLHLFVARMVGRYGDRLFEDRKLEFKMGDGEDHGIVEGVELALEKMKKGERAEITVKSSYGYGEKGSEEHGIPGKATLLYDVEMTMLNQVLACSLCIFLSPHMPVIVWFSFLLGCQLGCSVNS